MWVVGGWLESTRAFVSRITESEIGTVCFYLSLACDVCEARVWWIRCIIYLLYALDSKPAYVCHMWCVSLLCTICNLLAIPHISASESHALIYYSACTVIARWNLIRARVVSEQCLTYATIMHVHCVHYLVNVYIYVGKVIVNNRQLCALCLTRIANCDRLCKACLTVKEFIFTFCKLWILYSRFHVQVLCTLSSRFRRKKWR